MGFFLILFAVIFAFALGTLSGLIIGAETVQTVVDKRHCDSCDSSINLNEALFCEDCFTEDDKLVEALKEKEVDICHKDVNLKQRGWINKPDKEELEKLIADISKTEKLCDTVDYLSKDLDLKLDSISLKERNIALKKCVSKWKEILDREEKLDNMISNEVNLVEDAVEKSTPFTLFNKNPQYMFGQSLENSHKF